MFLWTGGSEAGKDSEHVLARLDNMWEDCCGAMWVEVTWFYFPEELHCGRLAAHEEREVFESHTSDETELAAIVRKVKVLSKDEFDALPAAERKHPDTYFCRYHYDPNRRKFMPIIQSLKKASLGGLETFKAQGIVPALAPPPALSVRVSASLSRSVFLSLSLSRARALSSRPGLSIKYADHTDVIVLIQGGARSWAAISYGSFCENELSSNGLIFAK